MIRIANTTKRGTRKVAVFGRLAALLLLASAVTPVASATAQQSWKAGACEGNEGVTVAVELPSAAPPERVVRCVLGDPGNARTALERTGLSVHAGTGTGPYQDQGYVCRINGLPQEGADDCTGYTTGEPYWRVWRVSIDPVAWRSSRTSGGPSGVRACPGGLIGFSFGVGTPQQPNEMTTQPEQIMSRPGWLPPTC